MKLISEKNGTKIICEEAIPMKSFAETDNGMFFCKFKSEYEHLRFSFRITVSKKFLSGELTEVEKGPIMIKISDKNSFLLLYKFNKYKDIYKPTENPKVYKFKVQGEDIIAKVTVHPIAQKTAKKKKCQRFTIEEWKVLHPFQGGSFSPR